MKYVGIDLGTSQFSVVLKDKGIVRKEACVVVCNKITNEIIAVGNEAKEMIGKTPDKVKVIFPMESGCVADLGAIHLLMNNVLKSVLDEEGISRFKVLVNGHVGMTEVEKRAVDQSLRDIGAKKVYFVQESFAAAVGAGMEVDEVTSVMMVNLGGGVAEACSISLGKINSSNYIRIGGNDFDEKIIDYLVKKKRVIIGKNAAESVKMKLASMYPEPSSFFDVIGRDLRTGLPKKITVDEYEVYDAINGMVHQILEMVRETLDRTPPELLEDINKSGIIISGGSSLIRGVDNYLSTGLKIDVKCVEDPEDVTINGICRLLNDDRYLRELKNKRRVEYA